MPARVSISSGELTSFSIPSRMSATSFDHFFDIDVALNIREKPCADSV